MDLIRIERERPLRAPLKNATKGPLPKKVIFIKQFVMLLYPARIFKIK